MCAKIPCMPSRSSHSGGYWHYGMSEPDYKKSCNNDRDEDYFLGALT